MDRLDTSQFRTWIEIDTKALQSNIGAFRRLIGPKCLLMAVVKSNAYGHGLWDFARTCTRPEPVEGRKGNSPSMHSGQSTRGVDWFGVDTMPEALRLRKEGIKKPILVLGYTLPTLFKEAARQNISLTISTFENLRALRKIRPQPKVHIKIDTGLHRQGFMPEDLAKVTRELKKSGVIEEVEGIYTHFAAAKDRENRLFRNYTLKQIRDFERAFLYFEAQRFLPFLRHADATGGAILYPEAWYDMVRIGIGLYGLWPSQAVSQIANRKSQIVKKSKISRLSLKPILTWKTIVSEIKSIPKDSYVGYELKERVRRKTKIAVLPVGYWHGFSRGLSKKGEVLIKGKRAKILGIVSMDMTIVDITDINTTKNQKSRLKEAAKIKIGEEVVLIGKQGKEEITPYEWARILGTSHYEILSRINPLIKRIYHRS